MTLTAALFFVADTAQAQATPGLEQFGVSMQPNSSWIDASNTTTQVSPIQRGATGTRVVPWGKASREYKHIRAGANEWASSSDGTTLAFAVSEDGRKWQVAVNGVEGPLHNEITRVILSADGKHCAYATVENGIAVYLDGKHQTTSSTLTDMFFSPAGELVLVSPQLPGANATRKVDVYVGSQRFELQVDYIASILDAEGDFVFSADGKHWALVAQTPAGNEGRAGQYVVVRDGKVIAQHPDVAKRTLKFSPDGSTLFYAAGTPLKGEYAIYRNGRPGKSWNYISDLEVSGDGRSVACTAFTGKQEGNFVADIREPFNTKLWTPGSPALIIDDAVYSESVTRFELSSDFKRIVYFKFLDDYLQGNPKRYVIMEGKNVVTELDENANNHSVCVSPSGKHWASLATPPGAQRVLIMDGGRRYELPNPFDCDILELRCRDDGKLDLLVRIKGGRPEVARLDPVTAKVLATHP